MAGFHLPTPGRFCLPDDTYMNNIAFLHGMRPVLQCGYYAGTFGEYNLEAIRRRLRDARP
jgi:hypothetical protein